MKFCYKIHEQSDEKLLAISDDSIVGKTFEDGDISIEVSKDFYCGNKCDESEALDLIKKSTMINAIGEEIIELIKKENLIDEENVLIIKGVPHVQIIKV